MTDGLWSLPGPARLAATVHDVVMGGASCAVVAPDVLRADDDWVAGAVEAADVLVDMVPIEPARPPAAVIAEHFGIEWSAGPGAAARLAREEALAHTVVGLVLPADAADWAAFAAEFLVALPGVADAPRPQLLVFCGIGDRDAFRAQRLPISEVWWWGTIGRLDTTIATTRELGDAADSVQVACITELCGFDIGFVSTLCREWDGSLPSLLDLASRPTGAAASTEDRSTLSFRPASPVPPTRFHPDWNQGLVDAWERYQPFVSPTALRPDTRDEVLRTRLWRGQLRELMPLVDEERARLETWVQQGPVADKTVVFPIEIGPLAHLLATDPDLRPRTSRTRRQAAFWLKNARNELAHRNVLSRQEITEGLALLDAARREA